VPESPADYINEAEVVTNGTRLFNNSWAKINGSGPASSWAESSWAESSWSDIADEDELVRRRRGWSFPSWDDIVDVVDDVADVVDDATGAVTDIVEDAVDAITSITVSGDISEDLLSLSLSKSLSKEWSASKSWTSTGTNPTWSFSGDGELTVEMGIDIGVEVYFSISLSIAVSGHTILDASLSADYGIAAFFGATLSGSVGVDITNIFSEEKFTTVSLGPVPVMVEFYVNFDAALTAVPVSVSAGVECKYGETARFGAKYDSEDSDESGIYATRTKWDDNGCTPSVQLSAVDTSDDTCPVTELGFDFELSTTMGAMVYSVIGPYITVALEVPFRITMPEFEDDVCSSATSACANDDLWTSFTIAMDLKAYFGGDVIGYGTIAETEFASATILDEQAIACVKLDEISSTLNDLYKPICCPTVEPTAAPTTPAPTPVPTSMPTSGMSAHMIVEGCSGLISDVDCPNDGKYPECAANDATTGSIYGSDNIAVQCCAFDGQSAARPGCLSGVTFDVAESHCASNGMRLCTMDETLADLGSRTGCEFSDQHVWTSTPCSHWIVDGCTGNSTCGRADDGKDPECAYDDATKGSTAGTTDSDHIAVQCCAMNGTYAARPGCVEAVNFEAAESHCATTGMRLCTMSEVLADLGVNTGCGFSDHHVWTATSCSHYDFDSTTASPVASSARVSAPATVVIVSWYWIAGLAVPVLALCVLSVCFRMPLRRRHAKYAAVQLDSDVDSAGEAEPMKVAVAE